VKKSDRQKIKTNNSVNMIIARGPSEDKCCNIINMRHAVFFGISGGVQSTLRLEPVDAME